MLTKKIIEGMRCWYDGTDGRGFDARASDNQQRNEQQCAWDSAILTAAELVRRLDNYDESRALAIHELLSTKLPK